MLLLRAGWLHLDDSSEAAFGFCVAFLAGGPIEVHFGLQANNSNKVFFCRPVHPALGHMHLSSTALEWKRLCLT